MKPEQTLRLATRTLALYNATNEVKATLRAEGRKLSEFKHREIVAQAEALLGVKPVLVTTARELAER